MKISIPLVGVALLGVLSFAQGGAVPDRANGPCVRVTVQNDRVNESAIRQDCDTNVSRTVQLGAENHARTTQTGRVNNNKVRQIHFNKEEYFPQRRSYR